MESCDIGKEAQELDMKSISERMKINKRSFRKIIGALFIYFAFMTIFFFFL